MTNVVSSGLGWFCVFQQGCGCVWTDEAELRSVFMTLWVWLWASALTLNTLLFFLGVCPLFFFVSANEAWASGHMSRAAADTCWSSRWRLNTEDWLVSSRDVFDSTHTHSTHTSDITHIHAVCVKDSFISSLCSVCCSSLIWDRLDLRGGRAHFDSCASLLSGFLCSVLLPHTPS